MTNLETFFLTILLMENSILITAFYCYLTRHCQKCQQVKRIERIFTKLCASCQPKPKEKELDKDNLEIF